MGDRVRAVSSSACGTVRKVATMRGETAFARSCQIVEVEWDDGAVNESTSSSLVRDDVPSEVTFRTVAELESAYRTEREHVNETAPLALILASAFGSADFALTFRHALLGEIATLAHGAAALSALLDEGAWSTTGEHEGYFRTVPELIAAKAQALVALEARREAEASEERTFPTSPDAPA